MNSACQPIRDVGSWGVRIFGVSEFGVSVNSGCQPCRGANDHGKPNAYAIYDDVKIFKGALTSNQILYEYKSSYSGKYSFPLL